MSLPSRAALLLCVAAASLPGSAGAWPVSMVIDLTAGKERFVRTGALAAAVDQPEVARAELMASGELFIEPLKEGRALVILVGASGVDAIRLRVAEAQRAPAKAADAEPARSAARKACPGLREEGSDESRRLVAHVGSDACRAAMRELLKLDAYRLKQVELSFSPEVLQAQLIAIHNELARRDVAPQLKLAYVGPTLRLQGRASLEQKVEVMKVAFEQTLGPLLLDDRTEPAAAVDGGAAAQ